VTDDTKAASVNPPSQTDRLGVERYRQMKHPIPDALAKMGFRGERPARATPTITSGQSRAPAGRFRYFHHRSRPVAQACGGYPHFCERGRGSSSGRQGREFRERPGPGPGLYAVSRPGGFC
jgi:hypothetical protein